MKISKIESLIQNLGQNHAILLDKKLIPDQKLLELFPGDDDLYLDLETGISTQFWAETKNFEALFITLIKTMPSDVIYRGEIPKPYDLEMTQTDVRALFGEPLESRPPVKMPEPRGQTGGWESYRLDPVVYPNKKVIFQYTASMQVNTIVFALIDEGHD